MENIETNSLPEFDKLWDYSKPGETETKFREILNQVKKSDNPSYYLQLLTQIGRAQGLQAKFEDAHKTLHEVEANLNEALKLVEIRYLLERGRVFNSSRQADKARPLFIKAWELALECGEESYAIDAAHMMGIIEPPDEQLIWNEKAIDIARKSEDPKAKKWLGSLNNNVAWTYHDKKEYEKALEYFTENVKWHEERKTGQGLIIAKWSVARTFRSLNKINEAIGIHLNLLKEIKEKNLPQDGYIFEELGECYLLKEDSNEARKYFANAYEILSHDIWLKANEAERLERLKTLSEN
jgi:tetratricopeptide (TPR) repeat protein